MLNRTFMGYSTIVPCAVKTEAKYRAPPLSKDICERCTVFLTNSRTRELDLLSESKLCCQVLGVVKPVTREGEKARAYSQH